MVWTEKFHQSNICSWDSLLCIRLAMPSGHVGNLDCRGSNMGNVEMSVKQGSDLAWQVIHWTGSKETPLCFSSVLCWHSGVHYPLYYSPSLLV